MQATPSINCQRKDALRPGFGADRNESVSSISGGDRGCAKALGAPLIATYATLVFLHSLSHALEITQFYWSAGVRCDITETRGNLPWSPGTGDRRSHERTGGALVGSSFQAALAGCRHPRVRHGGTPGYATHDVCAIWGHPRPG